MRRSINLARTTMLTAAISLGLQFSTAVQAFAGTDEKIASSAVCEGMSEAGRKLLQFDGSSLLATTADVTVICPIVRDKITGKLSFVNLRLLRPEGDNSRVSGKIFSCDMAFGGCFSQTSSTDTSGQFSSIAMHTPNLRSGPNQYYYFRLVLLKNWKIVGLQWKEVDN